MSSVYNYELKPVEKGYANRTLHINLENNNVEEKPVTQQMKDLFTGGRGFANWLMWNSMKDNMKWDDANTPLIFANGPICGITQYPGSGKTTVVTISPQTNIIIDSNGGGHFAPFLKFSGFDALEVVGKAKEDVVIFIDGDTGKVVIEKAPTDELNTHILIEELSNQYAADEKGKRGIATVTAGQGADHVLYSGLNISWYDPRRDEMRVKQAARGGVGRVFRDKKIKGIVVRYSNWSGRSNNPANPKLIREAGKRINQEISKFDDSQCQMRTIGTAHLMEIMDHFDLLPVKNYQYGSHPDTHKIDSSVWFKQFTQNTFDGCWAGCTMSCAHAVDGFVLETGPYKGQKVTVEGPEYETAAGLGSNIGVFCPKPILELNFYADTYGIDTISLANSIAFAMECFEAGIIDTEITGGLELNFGNATAAIELLHQMAENKGFGKIIGMGVRPMKKFFAEKYGADPDFLQDIGMEVKGLEVSEYITKESIAQQGGYAMAIKGAQHDESWLIFMDQVNNNIPSFEDKAEALHYFPMWRTWFSLHGLCKLPWNDIEPENNADTTEPAKVPEHVENYTWLVEGVTGVPTTAQGLIDASERVYTLQRLLCYRLGHGTRQDDYPPYRAVGPVTKAEYESRQDRYDNQLKEFLKLDTKNMTTQEKMTALRTYRYDRYETMMDAVYKRRGWDHNGVPTKEHLEKIGINIPEILSAIQ